MEKRFVKVFLALVLTLSMAAFMSASGDSMNLFEMWLGTARVRNSEAYGVNTAAQTDSGTTVTIKGFVESKGTKKLQGMSFPADKGKIYVFPLLEIENKGNTDFVLSLDMMSHQVVAEVDGETIFSDFSASIAGVIEGLDTFDDGGKAIVAPGEKVSRYLSFSVPQKWKKIRLIIFDDEDGKGQASLFELNH